MRSYGGVEVSIEVTGGCVAMEDEGRRTEVGFVWGTPERD